MLRFLFLTSNPIDAVKLFLHNLPNGKMSVLTRSHASVKQLKKAEPAVKARPKANGKSKAKAKARA